MNSLRERTPKKVNPLEIRQRQNYIMQRTDNESFYCLECKERVMTSSKNFSQCIHEHYKIHHLHKLRSDKELYSFSGIKDGIDYSEKLKNTFSMNLKQHEGYISNDGDILCNICDVIIKDYANSIQEHIKTKFHEDNVLSHLKYKLPSHLHDMLKFICFYDSNLSCDLCKCRIELNSSNVYETLVNIMSHNVDQLHSIKSVRNDSGSQNSIASVVLISIACDNSLIDENKHIINCYDQPRFECKLCNKNIAYGVKEHLLTKNIASHLNSLSHRKIQKASDILKTFNLIDETKQGSHKFVLLDNGNIFCDTCKCSMEADIEKLLKHKQNAKVYFSNSKSSLFASDKSLSKPYITQTKKCQNPGMKRWKSYDSLAHSSKKELSISKEYTKYEKKIDLESLLKPLQKEFGNINCMTQNGEDDVMCLLCDYTLLPTTHDIRKHLLEHNFKSKRENQFCEETSTSYIDRNNEEPSMSMLDQAFQLLPQNLQYDKIYIKNSLIQSYLSCRLCKCVINPRYLKDHLVHEKHIQKKLELYS